METSRSGMHRAVGCVYLLRPEVFGKRSGFIGGRPDLLRNANVPVEQQPRRAHQAATADRAALALRLSAPLRSSAARAALRGASPLPHLLQRAVPVRP
ncbi:hypothetical protein, partial [Pseudomonas sp. NPDC012596]|uniref:hypothetical protein n=1 Tax=Pseudomonas sp. NPDC012596 TaxID=3364419 RepID=UPI0036C470F1